MRAVVTALAGILFSLNSFAAQPGNSTLAFLKAQGITLQTSQQWSKEQSDAIVDLLSILPKALQRQHRESNEEIVLSHTRDREVEAWDAGLSTRQLFIDSDWSPIKVQRAVLNHLLLQFDNSRRISRSGQWRQISGWQRKLWKMVANNQDPRAYARPQGLKNPQQDFLSAAEFFILPPITTVEASIKCRTPEKFAFLKRLFTDYRSPLMQEHILCRPMDTGFLDDVEFIDMIKGELMDLGPINADTVKGFELLYATPGTGDASEIAGHLLLRIKLDNNPEATRLGIENPKDLVVSFLANTVPQSTTRDNSQQTEAKICKNNWLNLVDDGQRDFNAFESVFQSLKGLAGGFLTIMDRQPLALAIKNYTIKEDRSLLRYELILTPEQKQSLLQRLYVAKKNYSARYFFFNQNCASVLVKILGQGIGDHTIAEFNPIVSPPNALVALFVRQDLARPVYPSFHSYRNKAFLAQELMQPAYQELENQTPASWPKVAGLRSNTETKRQKTLDNINQKAQEQPQTWDNYYRFLSLVQESEMAYASKDKACENYTSSVVAKARDIQSGLIRTGVSLEQPTSMDTQLNNFYKHEEQQIHDKGIGHTKLLTYHIGLEHYRSQRLQTKALTLQGALFKQEMGSASALAMQRAGQVSLAEARLSADLDTHELLTWEFTTLRIRKFKQRLNRVPGFFSKAGKLGMGLSFLEFEANKELEYWHGTLLGGELLLNLVSSKDHLDFAFIGVGLELHRHREPEDIKTRLMLPLHAETLLTFGESRRWQWRNKIDYLQSFSENNESELKLRSYISYRFSHFENAHRKTSALIHLGGRHYRSYDHLHGGGDKRNTRIDLSVEINWW